MEAPVRVKLYGLLSVTKRGYLTQLAASAIILLLLAVLWAVYHESLVGAKLTTTPPGMDWVPALIRNAPVIILCFGGLFALEARFVLRRFAQKEAKQKLRPPLSPSNPVP